MSNFSYCKLCFTTLCLALIICPLDWRQWQQLLVHFPLQVLLQSILFRFLFLKCLNWPNALNIIGEVFRIIKVARWKHILEYVNFNTWFNDRVCCAIKLLAIVQKCFSLYGQVFEYKANPNFCLKFIFCNFVFKNDWIAFLKKWNPWKNQSILL